MAMVSSPISLSYPKRLFLWLLCYSTLLVGGFVMFQYHREKEFKIAELNLQLQLINTYILDELGQGNSVTGIKPGEFHLSDDLRISIISPSGKMIYDNSLDSIPDTNHLDREEIRKAIINGSGYAVRRHSESTGATYFYSAKRGNDGMLVRTAMPYSMSLSEVLQADYGFLWAMGCITLAMCLLGYFATRRLGQNILRLSQFAESAEKGVRISDTEPFPHDELGNISNHIVRLYARLQQANFDRDREHRAALHEQQEKERIKKQLTNNINHELKTPVASIQVCIETILAHKNLSEEKREEFLRRCLANSERLKRLLADVSLITRMDDGGNAITTERLNLTDIISDVVNESSPIAAEKGIDIADYITEKIEITGNQSLLVSVFQNLIDNAIAYSGGSKITIRQTSATDGRTVITFADNGCGVPEEHLPRLFERFYRIDKGRSRAAGGTGLGLSIVKNAVIFHGGTITASNVPAGGLMFTITFKTGR